MPTFVDVNMSVIETSPYEKVFDEDSINDSIEACFTTPIRNRPWRRVFGSISSDILFDPIDSVTATRLGQELKRVLDMWENRITDVQVKAVPDFQLQGYYIECHYRIPKLANKTAQFAFFVPKK